MSRRTKIEERFEGLQPDVTFTAVDRPLLMEFAVTFKGPPERASPIRRQKIEAFVIN